MSGTIVPSTFEIPLFPRAQTFEITLNGVAYTLTIRYLTADPGIWIMDIVNSSTRTTLCAGIPVVTGTNLLGKLQYIGIAGAGSVMAVYTDADLTAAPTYANLGIQSHLIFGNSP